MPPVLLLRAEALTYRKAFEDAGYQVSFLPVLSKSGSNDWLASCSPESFDGLIVTSAAALEPLLCLGDSTKEIALGSWLGKPLYAVGPATAAFAKTLGFQNIIGESTGNAASLSSLIVEQSANNTRKPLLFLAGNQRRPDLPEALTLARVPFTEIKVYESGPNSAASSNLASTLLTISSSSKTPPWIVLFSPSGFNVIQGALDTMQMDGTQLPRIATIGPTTSAKVVESGYKVSAQASQPTAESLLNAIRVHDSQSKIQS